MGVGLVSCTSFAESIAVRNVLYHHLQGSTNEAYTQALYYERRGGEDFQSGTQSLKVIRAGLAIDLGWHGKVENILGDTDEIQLDDFKRDQLHFHLARDAYRQQDWQQFEVEMDSIATESRILTSPQGRFLQAERARLNGDLKRASRLVADIDKKHILRRYSAFNLGVSSYSDGEVELAMRLLDQVSKTRALTLEQLLIRERSKIALANIELSDVRLDNTKADTRKLKNVTELLSGVTTTGPYGAMAVSMLANLAMRQGDYSRASELWYFAINNMPWHPAVRDAHVALPYSLEHFRDDNQVYSEYRLVATRLGQRQETLAALVETFNRLSPNELAHALSFSARQQAGSTLSVLQENIGGVSLANWLADEESQQMANRWLRLDSAFNKLGRRKRDLDALLAVDYEQQRRIRKSADRLNNEYYDIRLAQIQFKAAGLRKGLEHLLQASPSVEVIRTVATQSELSLLDHLQHLALRAPLLNANSGTRRRIDYLEGLLMYRIFTDLSVRVRSRQVEAQRLTKLLGKAQRRAEGIAQAAVNLDSKTSVSSKILALAGRTNQLHATTEIILRDSGEMLISHVSEEIQTEINELDQQLVYVRLAMARISDRRLLAAGTGS